MELQSRPGVPVFLKRRDLLDINGIDRYFEELARRVREQETDQGCMNRPRIFLAYASEDKPRAEAFADALEKQGLSLWLDEWEIRPGDSLKDKLVERIDRAFRESEALVLLLGPKSVNTPSLFFELGAALALRKRIIPVVSKAVDRSRIPLPLLRRRYVVQGSPQETAEEVARAVA